MATADAMAPSQDGAGGGRERLRIIGLTKVYATGKRALDGVDFLVRSPGVTAVIGSSGAGKSTFIRCINRLVEPTSGRILLDGVDLVGLERAGLRAARRRIGMIFQEFNLVERLTVMENVLAGRLGHVGLLDTMRRRFAPEDVDTAFELLDRVGLEGFHDRRADALSGGQRQRVGIARALIQRPDLLLVDEPTASLDPRTARQIMRLVRELATERATPAIVNLHDVALAREFADRVVAFSAGRIVFDDSPAALDDATLDRIYGGEDWTAPADDDAPAETPRTARARALGDDAGVAG